MYPAKIGYPTFTLLSSLEVIRMGCPGTHSIDEIAASCAPRIMWRRRPPSFKSHKAICPAEEAEASTGCPSIRQEFEHIRAKKEIRMKQTASESKCSDTTSFHEHSHQSFVRANIVDRYLARGEADTNNIDCRRLNKSCYCMSMVIGACGCQVWRCQ